MQEGAISSDTLALRYGLSRWLLGTTVNCPSSSSLGKRLGPITTGQVNPIASSQVLRLVTQSFASFGKQIKTSQMIAANALDSLYKYPKKNEMISSGWLKTRLVRSPRTPPAAKIDTDQPAKRASPGPPIRLKELAHYLGLNPSTISVVLNDTPGRSIPDETRKRVKEAARKFNYQPNLVARSFRNRRTLTLGILVSELSDGYHTEVMTGVGDYLMGAGYSYLTAHHRHRPDLVEQYSNLLIARGAEGMICIDTCLEHSLSIPSVVVAGHRRLSGVTNVVLNHRAAAELTLTHLYALGHRCIAFMRGQPFSGDSEDRWREIVHVSRNLGVAIQPELTVQLEKDISWPELGYPVIQNLFTKKQSFSALVCFNDVAAIGAIRAIRDQGLRVPEDISVIGFDDIKAAAYMSPSLTTIRQPLSEMGRAAAQCIVNRLNRTEEFREVVTFEPELVMRESTSHVLQKIQLHRSKAEAVSRRSKNRSSVKR